MTVFQGKEVIEYYINELLSEGVTHIPPWTSPQEMSLPKAIQSDQQSSQDSGVRSRSNSVISSTSQHSQESLVLGATAATVTPPDHGQ